MLDLERERESKLAAKTSALSEAKRSRVKGVVPSGVEENERVYGIEPGTVSLKLGG